MQAADNTLVLSPVEYKRQYGKLFYQIYGYECEVENPCTVCTKAAYVRARLNFVGEYQAYIDHEGRPRNQRNEYFVQCYETSLLYPGRYLHVALIELTTGAYSVSVSDFDDTECRLKTSSLEKASELFDELLQLAPLSFENEVWPWFDIAFERGGFTYD